MNKSLLKILIFAISIFGSLDGNSMAYDEQVTHKVITKKAVDYSRLNTYLMNVLGFQKGIDTQIPADTGMAVRLWLEEGSKLEDAVACRRANHFHNPLLPWGQSGMSDDPMWATVGCAIWTKYSAVTWATGYLAPDGAKQTFPQWPDLRAPNNWDNARNYYYLALTSGTNKTRKTNFAVDWRL